MDLRAKFANSMKVARKHPQYFVLGIVGLFVLNWILLFIAIANFPQNDTLVGILLFAIPLSPIAIILFGIDRLRRGNSIDEIEIRCRREITLRYFAISTLVLLIILIVIWRYNVEIGESYSFVYIVSILVTLILFLSGLFVIITWNWIKYSENKLSDYINKAPRHYLFSITALVISIICYIAYSDFDNKIIYLNSIQIRDRLSDYEYSRGFLNRLFLLKSTFQFTTWISTFFSIGSAVLGYLRPSQNTAIQNEKLEEFSKQVVLSSDVKQMELALSTPTTSELLSLITKVELNTNKLEELTSQFSSSIPMKTDGILADRVVLIRSRLTGELKELTKRGNLNLTIGILTTTAAASALYWGLIATQPSPEQTEIAGLLRHYVPRVSFAIFIEVFSFFFLRLYKNSLEDIKYYHNELTNLDSKLLALEIADFNKSAEALTPILLGLLNTDRNFILKSGESTVELEKIRTEQQYMRALIETISTKIPDLKSIKEDNKG